MKKTLIALLLALTGAARANVPTTQQVWQHHIDAWTARDADGIVSDYTDDSVILVGKDVYRGKAEIRALFVKLFGIFDRAERHEIDPAVVVGKIVYLTWRARIDGTEYPLGTDTFVIEAGKISYQTITAAPSLFAEEAIVLKNTEDLKWEKMLPDLGESSPRFALLRVDPKTGATTLVIEFPRAIHIPKHTHEKAETHYLLGGTHRFERNGKRFDVREQGYLYMPGGFVHEAWVPAGAKALITLEGGWKVDWKEGPPTAKELLALERRSELAH
jgi:ketosteroid isomerase-like protein/quercetin dioxygenase-like cupin family protein